MRKRDGVPSGELSDTRRLGSADARWYTSQGEKAVSRRRSIAARNAVTIGRGQTPQNRCKTPVCALLAACASDLPRFAVWGFVI